MGRIERYRPAVIQVCVGDMDAVKLAGDYLSHGCCILKVIPRRAIRYRADGTYTHAISAPLVRQAPAAASSNFSHGRKDLAARAIDSDRGMVAADELP